MTNLGIPLIALLLFVGCSERPAPVDTSPNEPIAEMKPAGPVGPALPNIEHSKVVALEVGDESEQLPFQLSAGAALRGTAVSDADGELVGISFLVGNYHYASRGSVTLEACVRDVCRLSTLDAASTIDNEMMPFPVAPGLPVAAGESIIFTLERGADSNEFAVWTFPAVDGASSLDVSEPEFKNRAALIHLLLK